MYKYIKKNGKKLLTKAPPCVRISTVVTVWEKLWKSMYNEPKMGQNEGVSQFYSKKLSFLKKNA